MAVSVHDNLLISYEVQCEARTIILRTEYRVKNEPTIHQVLLNKRFASTRVSRRIIRGLGIANLTMSGRSITELGLGTVVGSLAEGSALAAAGPYLLVGALALAFTRGLVCQ
jgi:hypothetical protein